MQRAETFNQGFKTVEYLASALVGLKLHLAGDRRIDADALEGEMLAGCLFVPYLAWVTFAGVLNLAIWRLN